MPRGVRGSGDGYKKLVPVLQERREEIQGPTVDALSHFEQAARRVIKLHQDWEQAKAREKEIREALMAAERILAEARSRLDAGLLAITTGSRPSRKGIKLGPRRKAEQVEAPADILTA